MSRAGSFFSFLETSIHPDEMREEISGIRNESGTNNRHIKLLQHINDVVAPDITDFIKSIDYVYS